MMRRSRHIRAFAAGILLMLLSSFFFPEHVLIASAAGTTWVIDNADLLTDSEEADLQERCEEIYGRYGISTVILTTYQYEGNDILNWERSLYASESYGSSADPDCVIFGVSMAERDWAMTSYGEAEGIFGSYVRETIGSEVVSYLSDGEYYRGFRKYLEMSEQFMADAQEGTVYTSSNPYREPAPKLPIILGALVISLIVSAIVVNGWKRSMDTKILQKGAAQYLRRDSFVLTKRQDLFLYHTVSRTRRERESRSGGGGGGAHSSGNGTHGKF